MNQIIRITALILILPLFILSRIESEKPRQAESAPVAGILLPALQKIKNQTKVPILLPSQLPASVDANEIHSADGSGKPGSWYISLSSEEGCTSNACLVGGFEANRGEKITGKDYKVVQLVNGIRGYYQPLRCGGSCSPPQISWMYKQALYTISLNLNNKTKKQDESEMIAVADSAIEGGDR